MLGTTRFGVTDIDQNQLERNTAVGRKVEPLGHHRIQNIHITTNCGLCLEPYVRRFGLLYAPEVTCPRKESHWIEFYVDPQSGLCALSNGKMSARTKNLFPISSLSNS